MLSEGEGGSVGVQGGGRREIANTEVGGGDEILAGTRIAGFQNANRVIPERPLLGRRFARTPTDLGARCHEIPEHCGDLAS